LGERELPNAVYYGVKTLRAMEDFAISRVSVSNFQHMISALAFVKKAAALANHDLGVLDKEKMIAIGSACDERLAGELKDQFTVEWLPWPPRPANWNCAWPSLSSTSIFFTTC
jgi:aspartate ammonia-lyase